MNSRRVGKFTEAEFVKDFRGEIDNGGMKLWDKETNRYATAARRDDILKKAYADIKYAKAVRRNAVLKGYADF